MNEKKAAYRRVVVKLSGEALAHRDAEGKNDGIYDDEMIEKLAGAIKTCTEMGTQIGIVIGAGNIWRGELGKNVERTISDHMGMLATIIKCL